MPRRLVVAVFVLCLAAGCGKKYGEPPPISSSGPPGGTPAPAPATLRIAVVPKAVTHQFWTTVESGARAAAAEAGAEVIWKGPDHETNVDQQIAMIQDFVTQEVDAIVMAACDADALVEPIREAEEAGVPVITIDSGVNYKDIRSLVATDNVEGGYQAGLKLFELIGGQGKVGLIPFIKGAASSNDREAGFLKAVEETEGIELVATLYSNSDVGEGKSVTEDMLTQHADLAGIFAANEAGAIGAANAIVERRLQGKVILVGFDGSPEEQKYLRDGVIQALVVQNPFKMGQMGVELAVKAIRGETVERRVDTGVVVVTAENIDQPEIQELLNPK